MMIVAAIGRNATMNTAKLKFDQEYMQIDGPALPLVRGRHGPLRYGLHQGTDVTGSHPSLTWPIKSPSKNGIVDVRIEFPTALLEVLPINFHLHRSRFKCSVGVGERNDERVAERTDRSQHGFI